MTIKTFEINFSFQDDSESFTEITFNGYPTPNSVKTAVANKFMVHPNYIKINSLSCIEDEKIRFNQMLTKYNWWSSNEYQSIGQIIYFIYRYTNMNVAEHIQIGDGKVMLGVKLFATYTFNEELKVPVFVFYKTRDIPDCEDNQRIFLKYFEKEIK